MTEVAVRRARVRRIVDAAAKVSSDRARAVPALVRSTGLSKQGVERALDRHLELEPTEAELDRLIHRAGSAPSVAVILSSNVFVGALRAMALALAAAPRVIVRPSRRDPWFAEELVIALDDPEVTFAPDLDVAKLRQGHLHLYGRDETIEALRPTLSASVGVRSFGAGMGVAWLGGALSDSDFLDLANDVVAFDQRGCLSPRILWTETHRAEVVARSLHEVLTDLGRQVPRGEMTPSETAEATRFVSTWEFAGTVFRGPDHAVALARGAVEPTLPPVGRHVLVVGVPDIQAASRALGPLRRFVVAVGSNVPRQARSLVDHPVRVSELGKMQRPPLDGPVDLRSDV